MDFASAWAAFGPDDYVAVSDGSLEPSIARSPRWFVWRSHNFVGRLASKDGAAPYRTMHLQLAPRDGATVTYSILESGGHDFSASTFEVFSNG